MLSKHVLVLTGSVRSASVEFDTDGSLRTRDRTGRLIDLADEETLVRLGGDDFVLWVVRGVEDLLGIGLRDLPASVDLRGFDPPSIAQVSRKEHVEYIHPVARIVRELVDRYKSGDLLTILAHHPSYWVRQTVAADPRLRLETDKRLSRDPEATIRFHTSLGRRHRPNGPPPNPHFIQLLEELGQH